MILYAISDRALMGPDTAARASRLLEAGVDWLQVREKDLPDREVWGLLGDLVAPAVAAGARLLVSGRPDLALAAGAHGVHLPSDGLPTARVRALCPPPMLLVRSCHTEEEALRAQGDGADAVTLGPLFATPSKAGMGEPLGLARFAEACRRLEVPVLALGGVGPEQVADAMGAGAAGIAAIRLFWNMGDPRSEVAGLRAWGAR